MDRSEEFQNNVRVGAPGEFEDVQALDPALAVTRPRERRLPSALGPPTIRTVMLLALPTIVEQVLNAVVGLTDTVVAGHLPGDDHVTAAAAAAVGVMAYLQWFAGLMTSAFGVGAIAIIARSIGARKYSVANHTAGTAMAGAFLVGALVTTVLLLTAGHVVRLAGLSGLAAVFAEQYLRIMAITVALQTMGQIGMASLRGAGDTFRPMLITLMVTIVNVIVSIAFAYGWWGAPEWGIRGVAFGTMVAYLLGGSATTLLLLGGFSKLRLRAGHLWIVPGLLKRVLRIGAPSWFEGMLLWLGQFFIVMLIINPNDLAIGVPGATMAAHNAVLRIESLAFLPGFGFGMAASALVGQYLGARRPDEAKHAAKLANRLAFGTMSAAAIPMVLIPGLMLSWLVDSSPVVSAGWWPMVLAGLAQPAFAVTIIKGSALKGAGETIWPMVSTISGMFLVRVPILIVMALIFTRMGRPEWGLTAVWIGIVIDLNYRAIFNTIVFRRGRWQHKRV